LTLYIHQLLILPSAVIQLIFLQLINSTPAVFTQQLPVPHIQKWLLTLCISQMSVLLHLVHSAIQRKENRTKFMLPHYVHTKTSPYVPWIIPRNINKKFKLSAWKCHTI